MCKQGFIKYIKWYLFRLWNADSSYKLGYYILYCNGMNSTNQNQGQIFFIKYILISENGLLIFSMAFEIIVFMYREILESTIKFKVLR